MNEQELRDRVEALEREVVLLRSAIFKAAEVAVYLASGTQKVNEAERTERFDMATERLDTLNKIVTTKREIGGLESDE